MMDWRELRDEYEKIPVPEEARRRVEEGIRAARQDRAEQEEKKGVAGRECRGRGTLIWMKRTAKTAVAAVAAIAILTNVSPEAAEAMEKIPVIGSIAEIFTFRTFEDHREHTEAKVEIPQIGAGNQTAEVNREIQEYADSLIAEYEEALRKGEGNYALDSTYEVVFENEKYVCLRIDTTVSMGSGGQHVKIFTVDKETGDTVSLSQLLGNDPEKLEQVSGNIKDQMRGQMAADENVSYFIDSDLPETDFQGLKGDESYYFSQSGELVIAFEEYQVAPGYMGAVEFVIPKELTGELAG